MDEIEKINKEHYDNTYRAKNILIGWLHSVFSFDQQSKSRRNYKILKPYLKKGHKLLDYGFGHGTLLLKFPDTIQKYGCELSDEAIDKLSRISKLFKKDITLFNLNKTDLQTQPVLFDVITCSHVLEHVSDDIKLLNLFFKKLNPNGILLINIPVNEIWDDPKHIRKYNLPIITEKLSSIGFEIKDHSVEDRLSSYFIKIEHVNSPGAIKKIFIKTIRFLAGISPLFLIRGVEKIFLQKYPELQLLIIAQKKG